MKKLKKKEKGLMPNVMSVIYTLLHSNGSIKAEDKQADTNFNEIIFKHEN